MKTLTKIAKLKDHEQTILAVVIVTGVVAVWRGLWNLMDLLLFSHDPILSSLTSIMIGLVILSGTHYTVKELM